MVAIFTNVTRETGSEFEPVSLACCMFQLDRDIRIEHQCHLESSKATWTVT